LKKGIKKKENGLSGYKSSCFPHFLKTGSATSDFIEVIFENGCPAVKFGDVFKAKEEFIRDNISSNHFQIIRKIQSCKDNRKQSQRAGNPEADLFGQAGNRKVE
jgi:hypothetical protein